MKEDLWQAPKNGAFPQVLLCYATISWYSDRKCRS